VASFCGNGLSCLPCEGKVTSVMRPGRKRLKSPATELGLQTPPATSSDSHHGYTTCPLLWPLTKARRRLRYRDYIQRCRICLLRPWPIPPNSIRDEASAWFDPRSGNNRNDLHTGTSTIRTLGLQKYPPYCIMIATANSVALKMGPISRMTMSFLG